MTTAVLLSGGVDSSVALRLLQEEGHDDLTAFYLKIWLEDELHYLGECPWEEDLAYARAVCDAAGVPLEVVPLQRQYWDRVVCYTLAALKAELSGLEARAKQLKGRGVDGVLTGGLRSGWQPAMFRSWRTA